MLADIVRNDHHGKEGDERGEDQTVDEDDQPGLLEVRQLGAFNFAVDLRERFLAAHGQHGMAQGDENGEDAKHVRKAAVREPSERAGAQPQVARVRQGRQCGMAHSHCVDAPGDEQHYHHCDQLHDVQGFFAGLGNALGVLPPEIKRDDNGEARCNEIDTAGG